MARNIATPALGPSLGVAPAGTCTWMSILSNASPRRCGRERQRRLRDSFITSPSWPVRMSLPLPGTLRRLDEEDVAAHRRPREAGRHARHGGALGHLVLEALRAEDARAGPRASIAIFSARPSATCIATWRSTAPISRSRLRTPASRV